MFTCKRDGGFVYEEEIYYEDSAKIMQLGCFSCGHKVYVGYSEWEKFKLKIERNIHKIRMARHERRNP